MPELTREVVKELLLETEDRMMRHVKVGFDEVHIRLDGVEHRLGRVEHRLNSVEKRLNSVERRLDSVEKKLDEIVTIAQFRSLVKRVEALEDRDD